MSRTSGHKTYDIDFFIVSKADTAEQVQSAGTFLTAVETYLRTKY